MTGIVAALAAIWGPRVVQFACSGDEAAEKAEWDTMQATIDNMMMDQEMASVSPSTSITRVSSTLNWDSTPGTQTLAAYIRDPYSGYCYTWLESGRLTGQYKLNEDQTCSTVQTGCDFSETTSSFVGLELVTDHFPPLGPGDTTQVFDPDGECSGVPGLAGTITIGYPAYQHKPEHTDILSNLVFQVASLTGEGNVLCNADGGPGGVGSTLVAATPLVGDYSDGLLGPGETLNLEFVIGLLNLEPFDFFVNTYGVVG